MTTVTRYGQWINFDGYRSCTRETVYWPSPRVWSPYRVTMREVTLDAVAPLTYQMQPDSPVSLIQFDQHGIRSDAGSIPPPLRSLFPHDECERTYYQHDSGCKDHGLYFYDAPGKPFKFCPMPSRDVHLLLRECFMAEKVQTAQMAGLPLTPARLREYQRRATAVYAAVRLFGPRWA